ncbi:hypothetical protein Phum_PHUM254210 [Pediculus humanus corporis]|uniref:Uncharacterized protein n=1 Tax=Pediculus humanus subsp. corporis TaxID=121224 RepID=E0VK15_PEDHC|nr:uncharacterized protein Phum_PHUM254210 [Pediculus humanus corporis]EEB13721.1 hypothetical protein Phum_PHUM254210 [Pediculus humanus corporis]
MQIKLKCLGRSCGRGRGEKGGSHPCVVCKATIETFTHSRPLPQTHASEYGLAESDIPPGGRVCNTCRCKAVRSRCTTCPLPTCPNSKGRIKRLRALPSKWSELSAEVKDPIIAEFQIPPNLTKCCSACFNRISRRLTPHIATEEETLRWTEEETEALKRGLKEYGISWSKIAEKVGSKTHHQCKSFYFNCRKKLGLDLLVQEYNKVNLSIVLSAHLGEDRKPAVTDEEESGSSTSSCDEMPAGNHDSSDTASACSPNRGTDALSVPAGKDETTVLRPPEPQVTNEPRPEKDYDSSATETADEGQGGGESENTYPHLPGTSITAVPSTGHQQQQNGPIPSPPRTVKDLMANVIEKSLMKTPGVTVSCSAPPTISSILKSNHKDLSFVKRSGSDSLATLSIVNSHDRNQESSLSPNIVNQSSDLPKEGIVVVQVQQALKERREPEPETLDLSIKKRDCPSGYQNSPSHHFNIPPLCGASVYPRVGEQQQHYYHHSHQVSDQNRSISKSPSVFSSSSVTPHLVMSPHTRQPHSKIAKSPLPTMQSKLSPKLVSGPPGGKGGSITHGTPLQGGPRYEGLLRQMPPQQQTHKEGGSITQGTPVHHGSHLGPNDKRQPLSYEYFKRSSPAGNPSPNNPGQPVSSAYPYGSSPSQSSASSAFNSPYPTNPTRQPTSYPIEQQLSSRQIIMSDYITSQQMHGQRRVALSGNEKQDSPSPRGGVGISSPMYYNSPPGGMYLPSRSPVDSPTPPPLRQGVIQRHNTIPTSQGQPRPPSGGNTAGKPHYPPPGHEAFSSLVEAAVQQPSLPVPSVEKRTHASEKPFISHREVKSL